MFKVTSVNPAASLQVEKEEEGRGGGGGRGALGGGARETGPPEISRKEKY